MKKKALQGVAFFWSETGTEGGYWAFQDGQYISQHPTLGTQFGYEGLHVLHDGDYLTIYDKTDPKKVVWEGIIALSMVPLFSETTTDGYWIHADQQGIDRGIWAKFFQEEYPAKLVKK
jgi:hypothetical protein